MIDFHTHILPAMDDGAVNVDESIAMAKSLAAFGYKTVCCTPHCIKGYYEHKPQKVREATLMLQADLDNADIKLELWPGMEYMLDECFAEYAEDLLPLGPTRLVLCEAPPQAHPGYVQEGLELIIEKGYVPLVAHPERTPFFYEALTSREAGNARREEPEQREVRNAKRDTAQPQSFLKRLFAPRKSGPTSADVVGKKHFGSTGVSEGVMYHANLGSFTGFYGPEVQRKAYDLLKLGAYGAMASDLHDNRSSSLILVQDKFAMNPYLKRLAEFDGSAAALFKVGLGGNKAKEQGELF